MRLRMLGLLTLLLFGPWVPTSQAQEWLTSFRPHQGCANRRVSIANSSSDGTSASLVLQSRRVADGRLVVGAAFRLLPLDPTVGSDSSWRQVPTGTTQALQLDRLTPGRYVVAARIIGFAVAQDTIELRAGRLDSVTISLNDDSGRFRCAPPRFRKPGESACAPESRFWTKELIEAAKLYADPRAGSAPGLSRYRRADILIVRDEATCALAARKYGGPRSLPRRVIVVRLGNVGFVVIDPFEPQRGGEFEFMIFFDRHWRALFELSG